MKNDFDKLNARIDWAKCGGLIPAIIQDAASAQVLMLGFLSPEALRKSCEGGLVVFYSRTKKRLWMKGEESGNTLKIEQITPDCDGDTLLILARPAGPVCHRGTVSCFEGAGSQDGEGRGGTGANGEDGEAGELAFLVQLENIIQRRKRSKKMGHGPQSYTSQLFKSGRKRIAQKVGEEGVETALAALSGDKKELANESADLLFHLAVLLADAGLGLADVVRVLKKRNKRG